VGEESPGARGGREAAVGAMGGGAGQSMRFLKGVDSSTPWQMGRARARARIDGASPRVLGQSGSGQVWTALSLLINVNNKTTGKKAIG
jgi:hypothetical protein